MISRLSVIRYGMPNASRRGKGRGGVDWFTSAGRGGGGWSWGDIIGSALEYIPRWRGPAPEPPDFSMSDVPARIPQDLPVRTLPRLPTIWDIGQPNRDWSDLKFRTTASGKKRKRMQCTNEKALRRAINRIKCFQKIVKRSKVFTATDQRCPAPKKRRACKCQ